jgi:hypothetical protein
MYCQKLVEMEYLFAVQSTNGKPAVYEIARDEESETPSLRGLTSIDELKKRLSVVGGQWTEKAKVTSGS